MLDKLLILTDKLNQSLYHKNSACFKPPEAGHIIVTQNK